MISVIASANAAHQQQHARAMVDGLTAHRIPARMVLTHTHISDRIVACWGWRIGRMHREAGRDVLVMERGYLGDRFAWTSLGWNGLNGRATFGTWDDGGARFRENFGHLLQPWNPAGEYVLLVGQVPGDAALGGRDLRPWYAATAAECAARYGLPVVFRPHPLAHKRAAPFTVPGTVQRTGELADALAGAALVVTFNSNTAVESLLAGKPTVAVDAGSMAAEVALATLPERLEEIAVPARLNWLHRLAWKQFTIDEIATGKAWDIVGSVKP